MPTTKSYFCRPLALVVLAAAALAASVVLAVFVLASPARANTYTVTSTNDSGPGSLRQAIEASNDSSSGEDTIRFNLPDNATITLASQLTVTDPSGLTIDGGNAGITISGGGKVRVFEVRPGGMLTLDHLTVAYGSSHDGAGIMNSYDRGTDRGGTLTVRNSTIRDNIAQVYGGGIYNAGTATVINSTISRNGGLAVTWRGGGIFNDGPLTMSHSTIRDNSAEVNDDEEADPLGGAGIYNESLSAKLDNTVLVHNYVQLEDDSNCSGFFLIDGGNNASSDNTCQWTSRSSLSGLTADELKLGPLADNGGATETYALLPGSVLIDQGGPSEVRTDQRGEKRPSDNPTVPNATGQNGKDLGGYDIGAYEAQAGPPSETPSAKPSAKQECNKGGWKNFEDASGKRLFKNQGQCIKAVKEAQR